MNLMSGFSRLSVQPPVSHIIAAHDFAGAHAVEQLILVVVEEVEVRLAGDERGADLLHERAVGLGIAVERERILARGERKGHQGRAPQAHRGLALEIGPAQIGVVG